MAKAAAGRAEMWRLGAEIAAAPTPGFVERLRDGRVADEIGRHTAWLGEETPFDELRAALGAFSNRSSRFSFDDDLVSLQAEWARLRLGKDVPRVCSRAGDDAERESRAWSAGEHTQAKELRARQFQEMELRLEALSRWCDRADAATQVLVTKVLVRVLAAHVTTESGRDLLGSLEHRDRTATFRF